MNQDRGSPSGAQPVAARALADDRRLRWLGMLIVLIVFGGFGTWAMIAPLSSAANAPGVIAVESYRKTVQHLEGGIVKTIHVRDGQAVQKDQVLITLDDTQPRAQLEVMRGQHFILLAREARLHAQREGLTQVRYPRELLDHPSDARAQEAMRVQSQTFRVRRTAQEGEIAVYEQQIGQLQARSEGLRAQRSGREQLVSSYRSELDDFQALLKEGYTEKQRVRDLERNWANSSGQLGELTSSIAANDLQVSETRLKIVQLQKELQREVAKELSEVQSQLFELREKMQSLQDTVARTTVRAPQAGTVLDLQVHTLGAVARPGGKLLDIVPQGERLVVEAKVSPIDIDRVRIGQIADIRFTAFKTRDTPRVDGKVIALSADVLMDEGDARKTPYYLARLDITPQGMRDLARQKLDLVAGMPAEVLINTGARTLFNYLIDPLKNSAARSLNED